MPLAMEICDREEKLNGPFLGLLPSGEFGLVLGVTIGGQMDSSGHGAQVWSQCKK